MGGGSRDSGEGKEHAALFEGHHALLLLRREARGGSTCSRAQAPPLPAPCPGVATRLRSSVAEMALDPAGTQAGSGGCCRISARVSQRACGLGAGRGKVLSSEVAPLPQTCPPAPPAA